jgi:hypothetical protein
VGICGADYISDNAGICLNGTSFASPITAGALARVMSNSVSFNQSIQTALVDLAKQDAVRLEGDRSPKRLLNVPAWI